MTRSGPERALLAGPAGRIETVIETPSTPPRGIALVAHPHPLYGGTLENKVAQTVARALFELGYIAVRPNFRGVGDSEGAHDQGNGETDDLVHVAGLMRERFGATLELVLAGYSFGGYVQCRVAAQLNPRRLVLIAPAVGAIAAGREYATPNVPADTLIIHGATDETVPLANVLAWAEPQELPIVVLPGCDHFFHRKLQVIRAVIARAWPS
jgi:uncharacterized protein